MSESILAEFDDVQVRRDTGAIDLILAGRSRSERGALPTTVLFSGATGVLPPASLQRVRLLGLPSAAAPITPG